MQTVKNPRRLKTCDNRAEPPEPENLRKVLKTVENRFSEPPGGSENLFENRFSESSGKQGSENL